MNIDFNNDVVPAINLRVFPPNRLRDIHNPSLDCPQHIQDYIIFTWSGDIPILWVVHQFIPFHQINGLYSPTQVHATVLYNGVFCPCCHNTSLVLGRR